MRNDVMMRQTLNDEASKVKILVTRPKTKSLGFDCFGFRASLGLDKGLLTFQCSCTKALGRPCANQTFIYK